MQRVVGDRFYATTLVKFTIRAHLITYSNTLGNPRNLQTSHHLDEMADKTNIQVNRLIVILFS